MSSACAAMNPTTDSPEPDISDFSAGVTTVSFPFSFADQLTKWMEDIDAQSRMNQYLASRGPEQRQLRQSLADWFKTCRLPERHIEVLVDMVKRGMSEPRLE